MDKGQWMSPPHIHGPVRRYPATFHHHCDFVATMDKEVLKLFLEVLLVCDVQGLNGREMFAIDGCKRHSSGFSKEGGQDGAGLRPDAGDAGRAAP